MKFIRIWAALERALSPGIGTCSACQRPWKAQRQIQTGHNTWTALGGDEYFGLIGVEGHITMYTSSSGCFLLCKTCWNKLSVSERLLHYEWLMDKWTAQGRKDGAREAIIAAVLAGN